jgi:hypothetical protein
VPALRVLITAPPPAWRCSGRTRRKARSTRHAGELTVIGSAR